MDFDIIVLGIIIVTSIIQSIFGVGVLLFGTPLLLLFGYSFFDSLLIVLPVSVAINISQILNDYRHVDLRIVKRVVFFTIPFVVLFLFVIDSIILNVSIYIGSFLIFVALKDYVEIIRQFMSKILSYNKSLYIFMGVLHGLTNLGGALLTAIVFHTDLTKVQKRVTVAASYMMFAVFQLVTILLLDYDFEVRSIIYVFSGLSVYFFVNKVMFDRIRDSKYNKLFSGFLIVTGILLIIKNT